MTAVETEYVPVSNRVFNPAQSLFKRPANDRAESETIYCKLADCPLRAAGTCTFTSPIGWHRCPYGKVTSGKGPTKRSRSLYQWCKSQEIPGVPRLSIPKQKLAFIGDYVFLPYSHMDMCKEVPFLKHSSFLGGGSAFVPLEHWTIDTVEMLIDFRPQALICGTITSYRTEEIPKFLQHIRELDSEMWSQLVARRPNLDTAPNYVGRKAVLKTLTHPIEFSTKHDSYPVTWTWDGEYLTTASVNAYSSTWGKIEAESVEVRIKPHDLAEVVVQSNGWVIDGTEFVD